MGEHYYRHHYSRACFHADNPQPELDKKVLVRRRFAYYGHPELDLTRQLLEQQKEAVDVTQDLFCQSS